MAQVKQQDTFSSRDVKRELYSDFLNNMNPHPTTEDLVRSVNENAVRRSIRNIMMTIRGERLFQPRLGSRINKLLFEPMGSDIAQMLRDEIQTTINSFEPRARIEGIKVTPNYDTGTYTVDVTFSVINIEQPQQVTITLSRVR